MAPLPELAVTDAYELWAGSYPPEAHNALMRAEERAMLAWLPRSLCGTRLVDIGCGSGRYLLHGRRRGATCIGVDLSAAMLRRAVDLSLPVVRGDVLHLPIASGWADRAVCALTLGHTASLAAALSELARVLRVRGAALCSEPHPAGFGLGWQRTFNVGGISQAQLDAYKQCREWLDASMELVRPGATTDEIAQVWPTAEELGFPDEESCFGLQFGHGVGVGLYEPPMISRVHSLDCPMELEEGMVFALETYCAATDGRSAARIEEELVVTKDGNRVLTRFPAEELLVAGKSYVRGADLLERNPSLA